jgi:hypothetical protein
MGRRDACTPFRALGDFCCRNSPKSDWQGGILLTPRGRAALLGGVTQLGVAPSPLATCLPGETLSGIWHCWASACWGRFVSASTIENLERSKESAMARTRLYRDDEYKGGEVLVEGDVKDLQKKWASET